MKSHIFLLAILLIAFQNVFAQETNIPSWPCTGSSSSSTQYINSTLTLKVILVEFSDIEHRNPSQDGLPAYTYDDFENLFSLTEFTQALICTHLTINKYLEVFTIITI